MIPSRLLVSAFILPAFLSVMTIFRSDLLVPLLGVDALILILALCDLVLSRRCHIDLELGGRDILSIGQKNPVHLKLRTRGSALRSLQLHPDLPPEITCPESNSQKPLELEVPKDRTTEITYHLVPSKRGEFHLGDHHVRYPSRLGLWLRQQRLKTKRTVRVYPDLAMIRTYELLARQHRQYALVRASRLRGGESEFARLRDYTSDDDYRFIDWKATARRSKLTSREFQLESDQNIFLILDSGRLMTSHVAELSQFDLALNSALLMAHVATRGGDRVGIMCFDEEVRTFLPPQGGPKTAARLVRATYGLHSRLVESAFQKALSAFDSRVKQRCLVILFTQLIDDSAVAELSAQLRHLSRKHLPLVMILEDTDLSNMASAPIESSGTGQELYDRGAAAELLRWKGSAINKLKEAGAHVIETPAQNISNRLINRYLEIKAHRKL